ncbi:hypothetical protein I6A84_33660 [Frankia sp. CNm7]|uniref:Uncharacterized protein n=1 Tax=Frankia nepalensis TaxID=1836974 RepID=A0A937UW10_9ACTN|nr:hypothetical protein [Frankia nepalensis]MBL7499578.1 hypothetical protein [Frankia nepalensis]MBL7513067.1 hypothetical protein [Frankia nepalensis]MBL7522903.1 hypothetical protein [Frankia nepalensis]MBL7633780.1 hypothetical protein [Frankia nepalensis]
MPTAILIILAVLLIVAGVRRLGADSRDGRDWKSTDEFEPSQPSMVGPRSGRRPFDAVPLWTAAELGGARPLEHR